MSKEKFNILVVDDSDLSRRTISKILEEKGYTIVGEAKNAEEAIRLSKNATIHLFIIDLIMPEISGLELIKHLAETPTPKYYLLISSLSSESIVIEAISSGANDFLKKPFTPEELSRAVEKLYQFALTEKLIS